MPVLQAVRHAQDERRAAGWDRQSVRLTEAPDRFISGEETAAVNRIGGRLAVPQDSVRRVSESGLRGRPTLVQNVETLAHVALIARYGPDWFRSIGTAAEPGSMLVTLSGVTPDAVVEVAVGVPLARLLAESAHIDAGEIRAVLLGGFHGAWIPPAEVARRCLSRESLTALGATPGAGVVHVLGTGECGLRASADIATYLAEQSARQCGPCLNGLPAIADALTQLAYRRRKPNSVNEIRRLSTLVDGRGAYHHPDGAARFVRSAITTFAHDIELHLCGRCEAPQLGSRPVPGRR